MKAIYMIGQFEFEIFYKHCYNPGGCNAVDRLKVKLHTCDLPCVYAANTQLYNILIIKLYV